MFNDATAISELFERDSLGAPEKSIGFVVWRVVHRYQRDADRALEPCGVTHLQFMTLIMAAWLGRAGDPIRQSEIARQGDIHPMQVSQILKTLERKGMVTRRQNESDVRAKDVFVTAAGISVLRRCLPAVIDVQERLFGEEGRPDGGLLRALLEVEGTLPVGD